MTKHPPLESLFDALRQAEWPAGLDEFAKEVPGADLSKSYGAPEFGEFDLLYVIGERYVDHAPLAKVVKLLVPICVHPEYAHAPKVLHLMHHLIRLNCWGQPHGFDRRSNTFDYHRSPHINAGYEALLSARWSLVDMLRHDEPRHRAIAALSLAYLGEAAADFVEPVRTAYDAEQDRTAKLPMLVCLAWSAHYLSSDEDRERLFASFEAETGSCRAVAASLLGGLKDERVFEVLLSKVVNETWDRDWESWPLALDGGMSPADPLIAYLPERRAEVLAALGSDYYAATEMQRRVLRHALVPDPVVLATPPSDEARLFIEQLLRDGSKRYYRRYLELPKRQDLRLWLNGPLVDERLFGQTKATLLELAQRADTGALEPVAQTMTGNEWMFSDHDEVLETFAGFFDVVATLRCAFRELCFHMHPSWTPEKFSRLIAVLVDTHGTEALNALHRMVVSLGTEDARLYFPEHATQHLTLGVALLELRRHGRKPDDALAEAVLRVWATLHQTAHAHELSEHPLPEAEGDWWPDDVRKRLVAGLIKESPVGLPMLHLASSPTTANLALALANLDRDLGLLRPDHGAIDGYRIPVRHLMTSAGPPQIKDNPGLQEEVAQALVARIETPQPGYNLHARKMLISALRLLDEPGKQLLRELIESGPDVYRNHAKQCLDWAEQKRVY